MKPWLRFAARLYPKLWRARYGSEFEALLDQSRPAWSDLFDILREALLMQAKSVSSYMKLISVFGVAGILIALAATFWGPKTYVAFSVIAPGPGSHAADNPEASDRVMAAWRDARSRQSLSEIIQHPMLNLYRAERRREPIEDVIEDMRRDLHFDVTQSSYGPQFRLSFTYPDPEKAQNTLTALRKRMDRSLAGQAPLAGFYVVLTPAHLAPPRHARTIYVLWGLGAGLVVGAILAALRWRARWTLKVMACGLVGLVTVVLLSLLIPQSYTSNSTARVLLPADHEGVRHLMKDGQLAAWLEKQVREVLDDASLAEIIDRPSHDLYRKEREQQNLQPAIAALRRNLRIIIADHSTFTVSFTYSNRFDTQKVVADIMAKLADSMRMAGVAYIPGRPRTIQSCAFKTGDAYVACVGGLLIPQPDGYTLPVRRPQPEHVDVIEVANLPESPIAPNREVLAAWGLVFGMALGIYALPHAAVKASSIDRWEKPLEN